MPSELGVRPYQRLAHDRVRDTLETGFFRRVLPRLVAGAPNGRVLDLGCGEGLAAEMAGPAMTDYTGVDLCAPHPEHRGEHVRHDLRGGLGPVGERSFGLYLGTFGVASHFRPSELARLLKEIAAHAQPGSVVALEALGLRSLEWPRLWGTRVGRERTLTYRLNSEVEVHPWAPAELRALYRAAGIQPVGALDRTVQAGPKAGEGGYWPGLPPLRQAMNSLLDGTDARAALLRPLPPLPAGLAAAVHHALAAARRRLAARHRGSAEDLAYATWRLEPRSGGGFGHGLLMVGRVT